MWPPDGVVVARGILPDDLIDAYVKVREPEGPQGWPAGTPYMHVREIRDLCCSRPVTQLITDTLNERAALHLNLTGWVSTERTWHQDDYLNPVPMGDRYCGVWMALDDIDVRSGPFGYVPGSHEWPLLTRDEVFARFDDGIERDPAWPRLVEEFVTDYWQQMIEQSGVHPRLWSAQRGDVLVWHSRLVHCGTRPIVQGMERRSLISHYSAIGARDDMRNAVPHSAGYYYWLP